MCNYSAKSFQLQINYQAKLLKIWRFHFLSRGIDTRRHTADPFYRTPSCLNVVVTVVRFLPVVFPDYIKVIIKTWG